MAKIRKFTSTARWPSMCLPAPSP